MTVESVTKIDLGDVLAVRYECIACGSVTSVPIGLKHSIPDVCPTCKQKWFSSIGDPRQQKLYDLIASLRSAAEAVSQFPKTEVPLGVRLEIAGHAPTLHK